ncbi:MAG: arylsulfatase, partial [Bacteroidota bacterium]
KDMKAQYNRTASVQHSVDGTFAYRKGTYKFISHGSSGGWSFPRPSDQEALDTLPPYQLYNLANDPAEILNLYISQRDLAQQMKAELENIIVNGRSTPGPSQRNDDAYDGNWPQLQFMQD